jgi:plastocyanin
VKEAVMVRRVILGAATTLVIGLLMPAVPAVAGGGGCAEITEGDGTTVEFLYACITPTTLRIDPGETVTFVNRDSFRHVIAGSGYGWGSEGNMREGEAFTATFRNNGVYAFQCYYHPGMVGAVIVGDGSGLGPAERGSVDVAPVVPLEPSPEVAGVPDTEVRTVVRTVDEPSPAAWLGGAAVGLVAGAAVTGGLVARRRKAQSA